MLVVVWNISRWSSYLVHPGDQLVPYLVQARTCITRIIYALEHPPWGTKIYALSHLSIISSLDHHVFSNKIFVCIRWSGSSTYALYNIERLSYTTSIVSVRYYYVSHHVICVLKLFLQDYGMSIQLQKKKVLDGSAHMAKCDMKKYWFVQYKWSYTWPS